MHVDSIAIGANSTTSKSREASVGKPSTDSSSEVTREITHVSEPTAPSSASTKKYTDDNDTNTLSEAKKYTDANTSNALVGTMSGKLPHVDDAWPSKPLGLTIDGAYKQDGTPSPENPVSIMVVENPVLSVAGKNLWSKGVVIYNYTVDYLKYNANAAVTLEPGTYTISSDGRLPNLQFFEPGSHKQLTCAEATDMDGANIRYSIVCNGYGIAPAKDETRMLTITLTRAVEMTGCVINAQGTWIQVENGTEATAYKPYVGASTPITLPAEHPYLDALPDGTHDEIVIDKDGNASLVARVGKTETAATDGINATVGTDALSSTGALADGATVYYKLANPVTYQLGKLDIPALPETISNVWIEANLTPECAMTYKQDINIAFDNLKQAIVATAAGE